MPPRKNQTKLPYNYVERKVETADILKALDTKYNGEIRFRGEWVGFAEFRPGTGYGVDSNRYIDFWAINCFSSQKYQKISYEIKVSRSDFMTEIKNAEKRKMALLISNYFYFAAPAGLIKPEDLPPEAGLVEFWYGHNQKTIDLIKERNAGRKEYEELSARGEATYNHPHRWHRIEEVPEYKETLESRITVAAPSREHMVPGWKFMAAVCRRVKLEAMQLADREIEDRNKVYFDQALMNNGMRLLTSE